MGANAGTAVPTYASGDVLSAANLNLTNSGAPVFADTSARDGAFGSGKKTLAEGQLCYLEDADVVQYYDGSSWATVGPAAAPGLELVSSTTIGSAVASVTVSNAFSATYDNYVVTVTGGAQSAPGFMALTLGATVTGYFADGVSTGSTWAGTLTGAAVSNGASLNAVRGAVNTLDGRFEIYSPNLAKRTTFRVNYVRADTGGSTSQYLGFLNDSTQYTDFTLTCNTGTVTGGQIRVYGYRN